MSRIYRKMFFSHLVSGIAFTLLLSLGVTYMLAASNSFLLIMAAALPVLDIFFSVKYIRSQRENYPELPTNRVLASSLAGFGTGVFIYFAFVFIFLR